MISKYEKALVDGKGISQHPHPIKLVPIIIGKRQLYQIMQSKEKSFIDHLPNATGIITLSKYLRNA